MIKQGRAPTANESQGTATANTSFGFTHFGSDTFQDTDDDGLPDSRVPDSESAKRQVPEQKSPYLANIPVTSFFANTKDIPSKNTQPAPATDRKMVYSAQVGVTVPSIDEAIQRFQARIQAHNGYLAQRQDNKLTCRVPADKFDAILAEVKQFGQVWHESMQAQDVTRQHVDLTIRLENAERARQRLLKLMDKATKTEDILKIEEQLTRLTETIERIKGELKYLNEQIAYSLVEVDFRAVAPEAKTGPKRARSRFDWINQVGIEQVIRRF